MCSRSTTAARCRSRSPDASGSATFQYQADDGRGGKATANATARRARLERERGAQAEAGSRPDHRGRRHREVQRAAGLARSRRRRHVPEGRDRGSRRPGRLHAPTAQLTYHARSRACRAARRSRSSSPTRSARSPRAPSASTCARPGPPSRSRTPTTRVTRAGRAGHRLPARERLQLRAGSRCASRRVDEMPGATIVPDFAERDLHVHGRRARRLLRAVPRAAPARTTVPGLVRVDVLDETADGGAADRGARRGAAAHGRRRARRRARQRHRSGRRHPRRAVACTVPPQQPASRSSVLEPRDAAHHRPGHPRRAGRASATGSRTASQVRRRRGVVIPIPAPGQAPAARSRTTTPRWSAPATSSRSRCSPTTSTRTGDDRCTCRPSSSSPWSTRSTARRSSRRTPCGSRPGPHAKTVYATYEAVDSHGQKAAGYITIQILPGRRGDERRAAPARPRRCARCSGTSVRIAVPLDGHRRRRRLGRARRPRLRPDARAGSPRSAQNYLTYEAFDDVERRRLFTYTVRDRLGKEAHRDDPRRHRARRQQSTRRRTR